MICPQFTIPAQNEYTMLIVLSMDRPNEDKSHFWSICYPKGSCVASQLCIIDYGNVVKTQLKVSMKH